ncbi:sugar phosphate isomerase/epimerase family protein [Pseudonocardia sp. TRM90224]|uniref:sugar phosphate isomerase/epimerase family protein n=1 Tax=Pseudonocardia sp. TRM90224 TaxID=2812678 RepID=UPI001E521812|nr:sugar phosphate isomerase/epimerase [Pseudonocardia sp. TRM90224]
MSATAISVQVYSVREAFTADPAATLQRLADIGFTNVEPYGFVEHVDALEPALRAAGLAAPSGHNRLLGRDREEIFDAAQRLGMTTVVEPMVPAEEWQTLDSIRRTAEALNEIAAAARPRNLRVGYHNHAWELASVIDGVTALEHLVAALEPDVVLEVDTFWAAVGGQDPAALLRRLGDRARLIHIKDGPVTGEVKKDQVPLGEGEIAVDAVLDAAGAAELGVVEFDEYAGDEFDGVARSLAYLHQKQAQ